MAITPIDMQVNMGHVHEVAKGEGLRSAQEAGLQQALDAESGTKSREVPNRVDENKKAENAVITRQEKEEKRKRGGKDREEDREKKKSAVRDERMGLFIDVLK
jgi:hypothetical protein